MRTWEHEIPHILFVFCVFSWIGLWHWFLWITFEGCLVPTGKWRPPWLHGHDLASSRHVFNLGWSVPLDCRRPFQHHVEAGVQFLDDNLSSGRVVTESVYKNDLVTFYVY